MPPAGTIADRRGRTYEVTIDHYVERQYFVRLDGGPIVATAMLSPCLAHVADVRVDHEYRRRGIATALYDFIEQTRGIRLRPDTLQTSDGEALWAYRRRRGDIPSRVQRVHGEMREIVRAPIEPRHRRN